MIMVGSGAGVVAGRDAAVRGVFAEVSRVWAVGDGDVFAGLYTEDATVVLPGYYLRNRKAADS
jgi:uncharacterized protein (TIGR02246 family)